MGFKEYLQKKKESIELNIERKRQTRELKSKLDRQSDIQEAKEARAKYKELKKAEKARIDIAKYKEAQKKERYKSSTIGKFNSGMNSFQNNMNMISKSNNDIFGKPVKNKKRSDPFKIDFGGDFTKGFSGGNLFDKPKTKPKKRKKRKKNKTITIKLS